MKSMVYAEQIVFNWEGVGILLTALFSLISIIISFMNYFSAKKRTNIEFVTNKRVDWINNIRQEVAEYITFIHEVCKKKKISPEEFHSLVVRQYTIRLYLNYAGIIDHIIEETMRNMINYINAKEYDKAEDESVTFINHMRIYLKIEWDRVKIEVSGEKYTNMINNKLTYEAYNRFLNNDEFIKETDIQKVAKEFKKKIDNK